jgi:hypothetical protein
LLLTTICESEAGQPFVGTVAFSLEFFCKSKPAC